MFRKLCLRIQLRLAATRMSRNKLVNGKCLFLTVCIFTMMLFLSFQKSSNALDIELKTRQAQAHNRNRTIDTRVLLADTLKNKMNGTELGTKLEENISKSKLTAFERYSVKPTRKVKGSKSSSTFLNHTSPNQFSDAVNQRILKPTVSEKKQLPNNIRDFLENLNTTKHGQDRISVQTKTNKSNILLSEKNRTPDNLRLKNVQNGQTNISGNPVLPALKGVRDNAVLLALKGVRDNSTGNGEVSNTYNAIRPQNITRALCRRNLPDALIIGAPKCGTAALAKFLSFHPNIAIIPGIELNFFSDQYDMGYKWYQNCMPCSQTGQITVERSSNYFVRPEVPQRIRVMSKWTKLILIVCEPVRRLISQFTMVSGAGKTSNMSFTDYLFKPKGQQLQLNTWNYMVTASDYSQHFPTWLKSFPFQRIHIVDGDNLTKQPFKEVSAVEQFLDIGTYFRERDFIFNSTKGFYCFKQNHDRILGEKLQLNVTSLQEFYNGQLKVDFNESTLNEMIKRKELSVPVNITEPDELFCLGKRKGMEHVDVPDILVRFLKQYYKPYNEKFYKMSKRRFDW